MCALCVIISCLFEPLVAPRMSAVVGWWAAQPWAAVAVRPLGVAEWWAVTHWLPMVAVGWWAAQPWVVVGSWAGYSSAAAEP